MANQIIDLVIPVSLTTYSLLGHSVSQSSNSPATINYVSVSNRTVAIYTLSLTNIQSVIPNLDDNYTINKFAINFYTQQNDDIHQLTIVAFDSTNTGALTRDDIYAAVIEAEPLSYLKLQSNNKQKHELLLGSSASDELCSSLTSAIIDGGANFTIGLRVDTIGWQVSVANEILAGEDTEWDLATNATSEQTDGAFFTIQLEKTENAAVDFDLYYTNPDATTLTPLSKNSLGGYPTSTSIYSSKVIIGTYSNSETTINIESTGTPESNTLCQIGPEIVNAVGTDDDEIFLRRGTNQRFGNFAIPSIGHASRIKYLEIDGLFDAAPNSSEQYRCVALKHVADYGYLASNISLELIKSETKDYKIDVGIELPKHNSYSIHIKENISNGTKLLYSDSVNIVSLANGFLNGAQITIDPDGLTNGPFTTIIDSFSISGGVAEFLLTDNMSAFNIGENCIIQPAPSQRISLDKISPKSNSGRFLGFFDEGGIKTVENTMSKNDILYLWFKRTINQNSKEKPNTGAVVMVIFN